MVVLRSLGFGLQATMPTRRGFHDNDPCCGCPVARGLGNLPFPPSSSNNSRHKLEISHKSPAVSRSHISISRKRNQNFGLSGPQSEQWPTILVKTTQHSSSVSTEFSRTENTCSRVLTCSYVRFSYHSSATRVLKTWHI